MKTTLLTCLCSVALALSVFGQNPTPPAPQTAASPAFTPSTFPTASPSVSVAIAPSATPDEDDAIESAVKRHVKKHFNISVNGHHKSDGDNDTDAGALMAIPIVGIVFTTLFGAPVLVVAAIMFFSYLKARSLHATVRTMVEKGQEVPAALFAPPPIVRARSDMRRGVVLSMVGIGLMLFFAAVNDWEGGAWTLGLIPFLIGVGHLLIWKMEGRKNTAPPVP